MATSARLGVPVLLAALIGCGSGGTPEEGEVVVTTYQGVVGVAGPGGGVAALTLVSSVPAALTSAGQFLTLPSTPAAAVATSPATGTIKSSSVGTVQLTGTFNSTTGTFAMQGSGYQFTATAGSEGALTGSGTLQAGGSLPLSVSAFPSSTASPTMAYCGTYNGNYYWKGGLQVEQGPINFTINGTPYVTNRYRILGSAPTSGEITPGSPSIIPLSGTATMGTGDIPSNIKTDASLDITLVGTLNGKLNGAYVGSGEYLGSYNSSDGVGVSQGTWRVKPC